MALVKPCTDSGHGDQFLLLMLSDIKIMIVVIITEMNVTIAVQQTLFSKGSSISADSS